MGKRTVLIWAMLTILLGLTIKGCTPEFTNNELPIPILKGVDKDDFKFEINCEEKELYVDFTIARYVDSADIKSIEARIEYMVFDTTDNMYCYTSYQVFQIPVNYYSYAFSTKGAKKRVINVQHAVDSVCVGWYPSVKVVPYIRVETKLRTYIDTNDYFYYYN